MKPQPFSNSADYRAVVRGFLQLHKLDLVGKNTSPEADIVRDSMDAPWLGLSEAERERVTGLSEDLYSLSDPPPADGPKKADAEAQRHLVEVLEARERGEWDRALTLLRTWREYIAPDLLSFVRGRIWLDAGDPEVAVVFFDHAARLVPTNGNYRAVYLIALSRADPPSALKLARLVVEEEQQNSPVSITYAAEILFNAARGADPVEAASAYRTLIPVFERTLQRLETSGKKGAGRSTTALAVLLLAFCHEQLGDSAKAVDYLSRGLQLFPGNAEFLVTRGLSLYGISPRAIGDFELAIKNGSQVVWPYLFLAHHYLAHNRFDECRVMCDQALRMKAPDVVQSKLLTWLAISQAELNFPAELVLATFEQAIRVDSTNEEAAHNLEIFQTAIATRSARTRPWERQSESAVRSSSQRLIADDRTGGGTVLELSSV